MCSEPGFIFVESFQAERSRFQFKGIYVAFIFRTIPSISVTWSESLQPSKLASEEVVRSKGGSLMGEKA